MGVLVPVPEAMEMNKGNKTINQVSKLLTNLNYYVYFEILASSKAYAT